MAINGTYAYGNFPDSFFFLLFFRIFWLEPLLLLFSPEPPLLRTSQYSESLTNPSGPATTHSRGLTAPPEALTTPSEDHPHPLWLSHTLHGPGPGSWHLRHSLAHQIRSHTLWGPEDFFWILLPNVISKVVEYYSTTWPRVPRVPRTSNGVTVTQSSEALGGCRYTLEGWEGPRRGDDCVINSRD